jgi:membrane protein
MKDFFRKNYSFLQEGIWRITEGEVSPVRGFFYNVLKVVVLSVRRFMEDRIINRAAALTYNTLLSIVPIMAIVFAIARGFGFSSMVETQLRQWLEGQNDTVETLLQFIDSYLQHAKSGVFIGVGLIVLLWAVITLTDNIERVFNSIWQVKKARSIFRKITDYFSIFLLLPIVMVVSGGLSIFMTSFVRESDGFMLLAPFYKALVRSIPYVFTGLAFTGLYIFMPNTKVQFRHAIVPGFIAGIAFQFLQYFYINSQIFVSNYNAIYGSFAAIPMFLIWTQASWCICLFGAELCYASQNIQHYNFASEAKNISRRYHDFLCILIMSFICQRFEEGKTPYTAKEIARSHKIPIRMTNTILYELLDLRLIYESSIDEKSDEAVYLPAEDINHLNVAILLEKLDAVGSEDFKIDREKSYSKQWEALRQARETYYESARSVLLKDLK